MSAPYHYGCHYSNSGTVLHFLVRLPPFTKMFLQYQGKFPIFFFFFWHCYHILIIFYQLLTTSSLDIEIVNGLNPGVMS